jgi:isopenicillin N synthase-like dioxygenase
MNEQLVPRLDLQQYIQGDAEERNNFVASLGKAFNEVGFVSITGHGFTKEGVHELYGVVKQFFELTREEKEKYIIEGAYGQRGYTGRNKETAKGATLPDLKEFWQMGRDQNPSVEEVALFDSVITWTFIHMEAIGNLLLEAIGEYLKLEPGYFKTRVEGGNSILRALHYFPLVHSVVGDGVRAAAHEDINLITLLMGASADGLELLTKEGNWFPVKAHGEDLVINVGDMLQRLTNGKLKSTTHRVVNPPIEKFGESRYSIPFFVHPRSEVSLACLTSCVTEIYKKQYVDMTAGEYLDERLTELGLK